MRHRKKTIKLGRSGSHRDAMLANLVCSLIAERRVTTTISKAKAARSIAEKAVTLGKQGDLPARRRAISLLKADAPSMKACVRTLFDDIAPGFAEREGGYTRMMKLGRRSSDSSEMVILEWVEAGAPAKKKKKKPAAKKAAAPKKEEEAKTEEEPAADDAQAEEAVAEEAPVEEAAVESSSAEASEEQEADAGEEKKADS